MPDPAIDYAARIVIIEERTFCLMPRGQGAWNIFEEGRHFGWFVLGTQDDRGRWLITESETAAQNLAPVAITATTIARTWADLCEDKSPLP